jgi:hypothetical protein
VPTLARRHYRPNSISSSFNQAELARRKAGPATALNQEQSMNLPILGIDIAKVKFNVCLLQSNGKLKHRVFPNSTAGLHYLLDLGHTVSVINRAAIKASAASRYPSPTGSMPP